MTDDELDALLRGLPEPATPEVPMPLDDALLLAFHRGELSEEDAAAVEARLAVDAQARLLLRELSAEVPQGTVDAIVARLPARRRANPWAWAAAAAALAAGVATVMALGPTSGAALGSGYVFEVEGGQAQVRGAGAENTERVTMPPDGRLVLRLRAPRETSEPRALGVFVEGVDGRLLRVTPTAVQASGGSFEVELRSDAWPAGPSARLWLHLEREEAALDAWVGRSTAGGEGWWRLEVSRSDG